MPCNAVKLHVVECGEFKFCCDRFHPRRATNVCCYISHMDGATISKSKRRPRFHRASEPPAFRLTEGDVLILRHLAHHRFLRSTQIAVLVGRSLDRTNDRLLRLFHAGYVDRPRAQLDYYPTSGSAPMVYALADRGARLLIQRGTEFANTEWSRKNGEAGRPFIEHQLEIVDFHVALERSARGRSDVRIIHPEEIIASSAERTRSMRNPLALRVNVSHNGSTHDIGLIPDLVFGLMFHDGSRRCFMVEIDRGTMPISRSDFRQTSFARKMRAYLTAHAAKQHEQQFGWKAFRVLVVTTDDQRIRSMQETLRQLHIPNSPGAALFFFATPSVLGVNGPLAHGWRDGVDRSVRLI
jgi:Replication-relaxation